MCAGDGFQAVSFPVPWAGGWVKGGPQGRPPPQEAAASPAPPAEPPPPPIAAQPAVAAPAALPPLAMTQPSASLDPQEHPAAAPAKPVATGPNRLVVRCDEEAWLEVRDSAGRVLVSSLQPAGTERVLRTRPPLTP